MTAQVLELRRRGRPSKARLADLEEQAADGRDELRALVLEGVELAARLLLIVRRAERSLAAGRSCATDLDELERLALRHGLRMAAAAAEAQTDDRCPDVAEPRLNHGRAA